MDGDGRWWVRPALAGAVALLVTAPVLAPGYVLLRDMVFVPRQPLGPDAIGFGDALPRAVPVDAVMALLTTVVPGQALQKGALVGLVLVAVLGAARLAPLGRDGRVGVAGAVAALCYGWSPYLAERLLMGHWSLLLGWAVLPWVVVVAARVRTGESRAGARLLLVMAPAALTPTGSLLAGAVAVCCCGRRRAPVALGAAVLLALPWIVAGLTHPGVAVEAAGVGAFAARGEGIGGPLVALLGTGGVWNAATVPASRTSPAQLLVTGLLLALWAVGVGTSERDGTARRLLPVGALGLVLAAASSVPGLDAVAAWAVLHLPGGGLLRDAQKWVALWALALAAGVGAGAARLARGGGAGLVLAWAALLVPLLAVPDLAWGVGGRLRPVEFPDDWARVRAVLAAAPGPGDVLVLPAGAIRAFAWNDGRPQLDPAPRFLTRPTVVDDTLTVPGQVVDRPAPRTLSVITSANDPAALARLGVGWVLVEHGTPGPPVPQSVLALPSVYAGQWLDLHQVPGAVDAPAPAAERVVATVGAEIVTLVCVIWATLFVANRPVSVALRRRRRPKRAEP